MHWALAALLGLLAGIGVALAPIHPPTAGAAAPGLTIRLSQSSTESRVGQAVLLTAVVEATVPGQQGAQTGWAIEFSGTANGGWTSGITTTAGGEVSYLHRGEITGSDTITASIVNSGCGGVTSNAVVHDWWQPQITLVPTDSVSTFGATATVTANLHRDNAAPLPGQRLTFTVQQVDFSSGQFSETVTTDANGNASISWQRPSTTDVVEAIRVAETDQAEPARAGGSHVWDQPIDQTLQIDLTQPSPDSQVGTDLAITATARIGGAPAANRPLLMYSTETGGLISQQTNADGVAVFHKTAATAGPDNLLFYFRSVQGSVSILHQWWTAPTIAADSDDVAGFVGRVRAPTATASYAGRPVQGRSITLQVSGASTISQTTTTDARGRASFDGWTRSSPGFDNVAVGPVQSSMSWIPAQAPPIAVALRQIGPVVLRVGEPATLSATATSTGVIGTQALSGWDVTLRTAPSGSVLDTATSDGGGTAALAARLDAPGRLDVYATLDLPGCGRISSDLLSETWALPEVTFQAADYAGPAGTPVSVSARLSVAGRPLPGELLDFASSSTDCALPDLTDSARTDQNGIATVSLTRDEPSLDRLSVVEDDAIDPQRRQTTLTWGRPPSPSTRITLRQSSPDGRVGTSDVLTAAVTHATGGTTTPVVGASVQFAGAGTGQVFVTGPDGTVSYVDRPTTAQTDQITASTPYGCDRVVSAPVSHDWWLPTLTLKPADVTSTVGDTASVRATLTHDGSRVTGIPLDIEVHNSNGGTDLPDGSQPATVDGRAEFSWSRSSPGTDTVTATETGVPSPVQASTTRRWLPRQPVIVLTATPDGTSGTVGDTFTVTAALERDGDPATGVDVTLTAAMPSQPDETSTVATDATGRATFSWTRSVQGTDQISLRATVAGQTVERSLTRGWTVPPPPPPVTTPPPTTPTGPSSPSSPTSPASLSSSSSSPTPTGPPPSTPVPPKAIDGPQVGRPGGGIVIDGKGCRPGQRVIITLGDIRLGTVRAASDGSFQLQAVVPVLPLGRYPIRSSCGRTVGDQNVDITEPQVDRGAARIAAAGVTTASTFVFFVLLIKGAISFLPRRWH